jgi:predicted RNase H-like HicB family nuclease
MKVTAKVTRSGDWWAVEVPEVPGVFTQAKRLDQVEAMVRDAVATMLDTTEEIVVAIEPATTSPALKKVAKAIRLMKAAREAETQASQFTLEVVSALRIEEHLTVRDVGVLLDVSPQRVSQIMAKINLDVPANQRRVKNATRKDFTRAH